VFKKQVDNLKTNYRASREAAGVFILLPHACSQGVYVLTDTRFRWLSRLAGAPAGPEAEAVVQRTLHLPCGLLRGALQALGVQATVTAEPGVLPACACCPVPLQSSARRLSRSLQAASPSGVGSQPRPLRLRRRRRRLRMRCDVALAGDISLLSHSHSCAREPALFFARCRAASNHASLLLARVVLAIPPEKLHRTTTGVKKLLDLKRNAAPVEALFTGCT